MRFNDRKFAHALRHSPESYSLQLDEEGWVDIPSFLSAMGITRAQLESIIQNMDKKRFEIKDNKIRAYYGHSMSNRIQKTISRPPDILYHGTSSFNAFVIRKEGLRSMARQYVHLSAEPQTATIVGQRKDPNPIILKIDAKRAFENGVKFYFGNETTWLSDFVPPEYISG